MQMIWGRGAVAVLLACMSIWAVVPGALAQGRGADAEQSREVEGILRESYLRIPANAQFPMVKPVSLGVNKSMLIQFPFELKDVLVSAPDTVDAVVQTSNRVFLIAKKVGQANAFFFDSKGQQVLLLSVSVNRPASAAPADVETLDQLLWRLVPGSKVKSEMAGNAVVLSGSVRTPIDSKRAADIACQFVAANKGIAHAADASDYTAMSAEAKAGGNVSVLTTENQSSGQYKERTQTQAAACASESKLVINMLSIEGEEQVMLKVTVVEMQRSLLKQLGVNVGALLNNGNFSTAILSQNALPLTAAAGLGTLPTAGIANNTLANFNTGPTSGTFGNSGVDTVFKAGNTQLSGALRALERDGLIHTLAEPNLTAVSGETAKFLAGGEYPIPVVDSDGKLSVSFKEFGVGLAFTPVVLSEGRISLRVDTEVSELTNDGAVVLSSISIPALKKRSAKSTVEMPSGGSLAIAGLISESTRQNIDGFPGLKDMPILGTLFRSRDFTKNETELVVIVTPYMVRPTARQNLSRPDDGFAPASDLKADFLGHLNRVYGKGRDLPSGGLKGDYGFIVE